MFANHNPVINRHAQSAPGGLLDVLRFTCATIQQKLETVGPILDSFRAERGASRHAFAWKAGALDHYEENAGAIYDAAMAIASTSRDEGESARRLTAYFASLPGLGMVKAGFVAQLAFGVSGCIDRHNIARMGYNAQSFKGFKQLKRTESRAAKIDAYVSAIERAGGSGALWDEWCDYVAELRPSLWFSGFEVSAAHVELTGAHARFKILEGIPF